MISLLTRKKILRMCREDCLSYKGDQRKCLSGCISSYYEMIMMARMLEGLTPELFFEKMKILEKSVKRGRR